jgi:hypothetical protein
MPGKLRCIQPLSSLRGVTPNEDVGEPPELRWVDPCSLLVDDSYQRSIRGSGISLIRRIVDEFDWSSFEPVLAIETPDGLKVTNGQHSATAAACHPRIKLIPVMVSRPREVREQAKTFLNVNTNRVAVTRTQLYHSAVVAGDEETLAVEKIARQAGVRVLKTAPPKTDFKPGDTVSVSTIFRIYRGRGPAALRTILTMLSSRAPIGATELRALELLMFDPDYRANFDPLTVGLIVAASGGYEQREAEAIAATHMRPQYAALAMVWYRRVPRKAAAPALRKVV